MCVPDIRFYFLLCMSFVCLLYFDMAQINCCSSIFGRLYLSHSSLCIFIHLRLIYIRLMAITKITKRSLRFLFCRTQKRRGTKRKRSKLQQQTWCVRMSSERKRRMRERETERGRQNEKNKETDRFT